MSELHLPWLELLILLPLGGAIWVARLNDAQLARKHTIAITLVTLVCAVGAWQDFSVMRVSDAHTPAPLRAWLGEDILVVDALSAPLLPIMALLYLTTCVATLPTKVRRFSFAGTLVSEALLLAMLSCENRWAVAILLALRTIPVYLELRRRQKPTRVFLLYMGLFVTLLAAGLTLLELQASNKPVSIPAVVLLMAAVLLANGVFPLHCWLADLFENTSFATALLYVVPMAGAYAAVRLVVPIGPQWVLQGIGHLSLFTAVYAAAMTLVQRDARRYFSYLLLSHSSLVLVGLEIASPLGLTGALSLWLSISLAMAGLGLTLRAIESRIGKVSLTSYHGFYEYTPRLAAFFLLTGLASVGFPGTFGFIGTELLVEGAVDAYPHVGMAVVLAAMLNGISILQVYFVLFGGTRQQASISLSSRLPEKIAVLTLTAVILGGGLFPQPGIESRHHAAEELIRARQVTLQQHSPLPTEH